MITVSLTSLLVIGYIVSTIFTCLLLTWMLSFLNRNYTSDDDGEFFCALILFVIVIALSIYFITYLT